jgi:hypothetical protein
MDPMSPTSDAAVSVRIRVRICSPLRLVFVSAFFFARHLGHPKASPATHGMRNDIGDRSQQGEHHMEVRHRQPLSFSRSPSRLRW